MKVIPAAPSPEIFRRAEFSEEGFVRLTESPLLTIDMQYPALGMKNAESLCLVREQVAQRLNTAAELLPKGYKLKVWDAWRPFALQEELYYTYREKLIADLHLEGLSAEERDRVISGYVSLPVDDRQIPPVHTTGGAVDVTVIDPEGRELPMGTGFDSFSKMTETAYFESSGDSRIRDSRRLLYHVMTEAGFTNLPTEWWHFDFGDRFWAYYNNAPAIYRGAFRREEIYEKA
ncbi:MAG: M15 family metallopeptidase [Ruminococcus sp.]|nr:M15 family metallopeptidase [Ruminococcus sp.]